MDDDGKKGIKNNFLTTNEMMIIMARVIFPIDLWVFLNTEEWVVLVRNAPY
jgi:hypothetical protein